MRRITVALLGTLSLLVVLFSYHTSLDRTGTVSSLGAPPVTPPKVAASIAKVPAGVGTKAGTAKAGSAKAGTAKAGTAKAGTAKAAPATSAGVSGQFTGQSQDTQWGPVQVQITVSNGKITAASAVVVPDGNGRDYQINSYAVPILNQEAVQAQSAQIDSVSGATVTSGGYIPSLQSAIDQAHLS